MSTKRNRRGSDAGEWTCETLNEAITTHLDLLSNEMDRRFDAQAVATTTAMSSAEKAVLKAENLATARSEQQNEWRGTVNDLINTMMPRNEYRVIHEALAHQVTDAVSLLTAHLGEKAGGGESKYNAYLIVVTITSVLAVLMSAASVLVALFLHYAH